MSAPLSIEEAAAAMYAADEAVEVAKLYHGRGSDEWIAARMAAADAHHAYWGARDARAETYIKTIGRG